MTTLLRLSRIIGVATCCLMLAACSAIKLGYNNLPQISYWWLDGYIDFTDEQALRVREDLAALQRWHRAQELPRAVRLLARMEQMAAGDITPRQACAVVEDVRERLVAVGDHLESAVVSMALSLQPRQLRHIQRRMERSNTQFRREWIEPPPGERTDKRLEQLQGRLDTLYGHLEGAQREALRQSLERSIFDPARILAERQRRQADLMQVLDKVRTPGTTPEAARALLRGYVERLQTAPDPAQQRFQQQLLAESCATFAAMHNASTPTQRRNAAARLRAWQRDLGELATSS